MLSGESVEVESGVFIVICDGAVTQCLSLVFAWNLGVSADCKG